MATLTIVHLIHCHSLGNGAIFIRGEQGGLGCGEDWEFGMQGGLGHPKFDLFLGGKSPQNSYMSWS